MLFDIGEIALAIEKEAQYQDGMITFPGYLWEQLYNELFPETPKHNFTEEK